jgi:hypothetical protein
LEECFSGDLHTSKFSDKEDFETYLCALAYGSIGKELFYDQKFSYQLSEKLKNNDEFMQGMATYSIMQKINKANFIINSLDFAKNLKIDFSKEDLENDYATIAFTLYYLSTKGYKVEWNKMSHDYSPINLSNGSVCFKKGATSNPEQLIENIKTDLNVKSL